MEMHIGFILGGRRQIRPVLTKKTTYRRSFFSTLMFHFIAAIIDLLHEEVVAISRTIGQCV